jgi:hypothetical protein
MAGLVPAMTVFDSCKPEKTRMPGIGPLRGPAKADPGAWHDE